ncbi:MAG: cadherin-like beta sandwich domain-containing protein [Bacilli bacterium]|nr:cadherin-like beta sandwich domain-containing protein [Bacilli bacterium]
MKKIKILLLLLLFVFPLNVFAANNKAKIDAPKMTSKGEEISVSISVTSDTAINGFKGTFTYETSALELLSIENKNGWKQVSEFSKGSPVTLDFTHGNGLTGETTILTLKFKVKEDVAKNSTVLNLEGTTKNEEDEMINTLEKVTSTVEIKSTDNSLKDLKLNGKTITNFSPTTYSYSIQVDSTVTTANFDAVLNDKTATFKDKYEPRTGVSLDYGDNNFEIIVVSASGDEKKYEVTLIRQDNRGTNNDLQSLIINSNPKLFEFDKNTLTYTFTTHKLKDIDIVATPADSKATVKIDKKDALVIGSNEIKITVISESKDEKVYTLIINNLDTEINTKLKNIELFGCDETLDFENDKYDYEIIYKAKYKDSLVIKPVVSNEDEAVATIDKTDLSTLKPGEKVTITVSAKDGTKNVENYYTILFKKDNRINFFLILGLIIFIVLLIIFIKMLLNYKKTKKELVVEIDKKEKDLEKTKRLEKKKNLE